MVFLCCATGAYVKTYELTSESMQLHRAMSSLNAEVTCARYNHNGKIIASCSVDGGICLDVASSGELLSRFFYPAKSIVDRRVNAVHFSSGSRFLASGGSDGCVRVWDLKTQEVTQTYSIGASAVTSVTFSGYKDDFIVAGSQSGAISVCDVQSTETVGFLSVDPKFPVSAVTSVLASPHPYARQIVGSTYADGSVRVWDLHTGQLSAEFANHHDAAASCLAISPVSKVLLATGGHDRRVLFFDSLQRRELRSMDFNAPISSLALCADGKTLAVGTVTGEVLVCDLRGAITPLYATSVGDNAGGGSSSAGATAVNSLQFSSPNVDSTNTGVSPQGQPIIATERMNGGFSSPEHKQTSVMSPQTNPSPLSMDDYPHHAVDFSGLFSPPAKSLTSRNSSFTISTHPHEQPSNQGNASEPNELSILQQHSIQHESSPHELLPELNGVQKSSPTRLGETPASRMAEPSLLSLLAETSPKHTRPHELPPPIVREPALPLTSPTAYSTQATTTFDTERHLLKQEVEKMQAKIDQDHHEQQSQMQMLMQTVLLKYDALLEENVRLRRDNESLLAHIQQQNESAGMR